MESRLNYFIDGKHTDLPILFIHGWPDSSSLWDQQVKLFSARYCCARVDLPAFGSANDKAGPTESDSKSRTSDTPDFLTMLELLKNTVDDVLCQTRRAQIILVGHDWGAYLCYLFEQKYPERVTRLVTLDVGAQVKPGSLGQALFMVSYQWWLISAWELGKVMPSVGDAMSQVLARRMKAPRPADVRARMNYPYFHFWRGIFSGRYRSQLLHDYKPRCPTLYLYGKRKPFMLHSAEWLHVLSEDPRHGVVGLDDAGHWLMLDQPEQTHAAIKQWLDQSGLA